MPWALSKMVSAEPLRSMGAELVQPRSSTKRIPNDSAKAHVLGSLYLLSGTFAMFVNRKIPKHDGSQLRSVSSLHSVSTECVALVPS